MYINLEKTQKNIEFGDIVKYDDDTCIVIDSDGFGNNDFPVLVISLSKSKVLNTFKNLDYLNKSSCEFIAEEDKVEIKFIEKLEGY